MKKIISLALFIALAVSCVIPAAPAEDKKLSVVATIFPIYDWTRARLSRSFWTAAWTCTAISPPQPIS